MVLKFGFALVQCQTVTMSVVCRSDDDPALEGVIPRSVSDIFRHIQSSDDTSQYNLTVSFLELYNEQLFDLLNPQVCTLQKLQVSKNI